MRVHELAKELGLTNKDLLDRLAAMGSTAKQASNALDAETIAKVKAALAAPPAAAAKPAPAPAPAANATQGS